MKLTCTLTTVTGEDKTVDVYPEEVSGLMSVIMQMASAKPDAPVCLTITRKDVVRKLRKSDLAVG